MHWGTANFCLLVLRRLSHVAVRIIIATCTRTSLPRVLSTFVYPEFGCKIGFPQAMVLTLKKIMASGEDSRVLAESLGPSGVPLAREGTAESSRPPGDAGAPRREGGWPTVCAGLRGRPSGPRARSARVPRAPLRAAGWAPFQGPGSTGGLRKKSNHLWSEELISRGSTRNTLSALN